MSSAWQPDDVRERLSFAKKRLDELLALGGGNLQSASGADRQQLMQEFLFHLVGATEMLAQLVNQSRGPFISPESVSVQGVARALPEGDGVRAQLEFLHPRTKGVAPLPNPYDDEGIMFRVLVYRHFVTHQKRNPFLFRWGSTPLTSLFLDPRDPERTPSAKAAQDELRASLKLVEEKCEDVLAAL